MAHKRYIHRHGKRHGPYYYKTVRDESGKVRSVYLGKASERGKRPLKITIIFLFALLIIISALFFLQNRAIVLSKISAEESAVPFETDQILIKVLVKSGESLEKELRVMNVGNEGKAINVDISGLGDIVAVLDKDFEIKPGQTKIVRLNFSSASREKGIEQEPGVYIGKISVQSGSYKIDTPVIVEVESKNVLFDMNLNPVARDRNIMTGESTTFEIRVFNLQNIESYNVDMDYFVKDINGNTIISESENVVVKTQASFFKTLKVPQNLKPGNYVFVARASFGNSAGTASYLFEVEEAERESRTSGFIGFCRNDPLCLSLSIIVMLLIFTIGAYLYFFIGAYIYRRLFGARVAETRRIEKPAEEISAAEKKKKSMMQAFRDWSSKRRRAKELRIKKKIEVKRQKLKLKEEQEKLKISLKLQKGREEERKNRRKGEERREKEIEKKRKEKQKRKEKKKRRFEFLHKLGLAKTEEEEKEIERQKREKKEQREREKLRLEEEKRLREAEREKLEEDREEERLKELKEREELEGRKAREEEAKTGKAGKCRRLIEKGYKALENDKIGKAERLYEKIMQVYIHIPTERKIDIFKEVNSFYKSLLLKKDSLKHKIEKRRESEEAIKKQKELEKKKVLEKKAKEKAIRERLREEKGKEKKKRRFEFLHKLGLAKTEEEKKEIEKQKQGKKEQREREKLRLEEEKRKQREAYIKKKGEEKRLRESEKKAEEERRKKELEEQEKEEEERKQKELERKKGWRAEKQKQREAELRKKEEEKRLREAEKKKLEEGKREEKEQELKKRELERKKIEEQKRKERELERQRKNEGRRKEEEERKKDLDEIKSIEDEISRKDGRIGELRGNAKSAVSEIEGLGREISKLQRSVEGINNQKEAMLKKYNEEMQKRKELEESYKSKIKEWKESYDAKANEKASLEKNAKADYENALRNLDEELQGLDAGEREEHEKWKKLELKAKSKLQEKDREKALGRKLNELLKERQHIDDEWMPGKEAAGKPDFGSEQARKIKELDGNIRKNGKSIEELKLKIAAKDKAIKSIESSIENTAKEKKKLLDKIAEKKREIGGISYITSIFSFIRKKPTGEIKEGKERKSAKAELKEEIEKALIQKEELKGAKEKPKKEEKAAGEAGIEKELEELEKAGQQEEKPEKGKEEKSAWKKPEEQIKEKKGVFFPGLFKGMGKKPEKAGEEKAGEKAKDKKESIFSGLFRNEREKNKAAGGKAEEEKPEEHDLEKSIHKLGERLGQKREEKPGLIKRMMEKGREKKEKAEKDEEEKEPREKISELKKKAEGKSWKFAKCRKMLVKADEALGKNDKAGAKKIYLKARDIYTRLEYMEKKELYGGLLQLYNKLSK